jgi:hypothetical protein
MQEELNNFKTNEVWSLVARPKQNVVGTKWVFRNKQDEHTWQSGQRSAVEALNGRLMWPRHRTCPVLPTIEQSAFCSTTIIEWRQFIPL